MFTEFFLGEEKQFKTSIQVNNTLHEEGMSLSQSTIQRRLHEYKYRGFITRCKPLVTIENREARKHPKRMPAVLGQDSLDRWNQDVPEWWEEKSMIRDPNDPKPPLHLSNTAEAVLWRGHVWLPMELGHWCLLMMWLLKEAVGWRLKSMPWAQI